MSSVLSRDRPTPRRQGRGAETTSFVREAAYSSGRVRLDTVAASSRGSFHAVNEDGCSTLDGASPLFVVADGVSLGAMASRASSELVSRLHETLEQGPMNADSVRSAVLDADREVGRSIARRTDASGAATVALCAGAGASLSRWLVAWVGDCRVYRVSAAGGPAQLLTRDDSYRHLSEQPPHGAALDDPARMVGNGAVDAPNLCDVDLGPDEMLLLCSDGVHKHAEPDDIARLLRGHVPLAKRCVRLIEFARSRGSSDDATALIVHRIEPQRAWRARLLALAALITLVGGALLWFAADRVIAQHLQSIVLPNTKAQS